MIVTASLLGVVAALRLGDVVPNRRSIRIGPVSALIQSRVIVIGVAGLILAGTLLVIGLIVGDFPIGAWDALGEAFRARGGEFDFTSTRSASPE